MHKPEFVLENETNKIFWNFEIQTEKMISSRRPDIVKINRKKKKNENLLNSRLCHPG